MYVLSVNEDTWKINGWRVVAVFDNLSEAREQGERIKSELLYAGYRVIPVSLNPTYESWREEDNDALSQDY